MFLIFWSGSRSRIHDFAFIWTFFSECDMTFRVLTFVWAPLSQRHQPIRTWICKRVYVYLIDLFVELLTILVCLHEGFWSNSHLYWLLLLLHIYRHTPMCVHICLFRPICITPCPIIVHLPALCCNEPRAQWGLGIWAHLLVFARDCLRLVRIPFPSLLNTLLPSGAADSRWWHRPSRFLWVAHSTCHTKRVFIRAITEYLITQFLYSRQKATLMIHSFLTKWGLT